MSHKSGYIVILDKFHYEIRAVSVEYSLDIIDRQPTLIVNNGVDLFIDDLPATPCYLRYELGKIKIESPIKFKGRRFGNSLTLSGACININ